MVDIYDDISSVEELVRRHNRIFLYGAGASCRLLLASFWKEVLRDHVECVVDANPDLSGTKINVGEDEVDVIDIQSFTGQYCADDRDIVFLLTPAFSSLIIERLDLVEELDGIKVYLLPMICRKQEAGEFDLRSTDEAMIPKTIHYFWIGEAPIPDDYKRNIEGWKRLNPEYEIRCWNEENYDFDSVSYMSEAYHMGKEYLMFATDYARMDILYRYGGIYLDTDVELLKPLDDLLYNRGFVGEEENAQINSGSAIGTVKGHPMLEKLMSCYKDRHFLNEDGRPKRAYNTFFETKCFIENGYRMVNSYQTVCDMACFPREVFMPICFAGMEDCFSDRTVSNHRINPEHHMMHKKAYEKWKERVRL